MDTLLLSRIQFAANISFHILFPTITIALCWFLLYFRLRHDAAAERPASWRRMAGSGPFCGRAPSRPPPSRRSSRAPSWPLRFA